MKWQTLPPVGRPVDWHLRGSPSLGWADYTGLWLDSGTSALAAALRHAASYAPGQSKPEVIVPGYCCPDLVAAALYSGFTPVVVDIHPNDPGYDLEQLQSALTANTKAVIAINFLGIRERLAAIQNVLPEDGSVVVIEDNAQWFPSKLEPCPIEADYTVFSFGRGKPINLMGGGLLAIHRDRLTERPAPQSDALETEPRWRWMAKAVAMNTVLKPRFYHWVTRLPTLNLGETEYKALEAIEAMPQWKLAAFSSNFERYRSAERIAERALRRFFSKRGSNRMQEALERSERLLRYPLLTTSEDERETLIQRLSEQGLGASRFYKTTLPEVKGVDASMLRVVGELENARSFARRLLTLPTHPAVNDRAIREIESVVVGQ